MVESTLNGEFVTGALFIAAGSAATVLSSSTEPETVKLQLPATAVTLMPLEGIVTTAATPGVGSSTVSTAQADVCVKTKEPHRAFEQPLNTAFPAGTLPTPAGDSAIPLNDDELQVTVCEMVVKITLAMPEAAAYGLATPLGVTVRAAAGLDVLSEAASAMVPIRIERSFMAPPFVLRWLVV